MSWPSSEWTACRFTCCRDPSCAGWSHSAKSGRAMCNLRRFVESNTTGASAGGASCGVARASMPVASPSNLPEGCGGLAYVDFMKTRAGTPYVRVDATSHVDCQAQCCSDATCRGWTFSVAEAGPPCAMIEMPGEAYAASSVISGCVCVSSGQRLGTSAAPCHGPWRHRVVPCTCSSIFIPAVSLCPVSVSCSPTLQSLPQALPLSFALARRRALRIIRVCFQLRHHRALRLLHLRCVAPPAGRLTAAAGAAERFCDDRRGAAQAAGAGGGAASAAQSVHREGRTAERQYGASARGRCGRRRRCGGWAGHGGQREHWRFSH